MNGDSVESVFGHRSQIWSFVRNGLLSEEVVSLLLPDGQPLLYERQLWDYKLELPVLPKGGKPSEIELEEYNGAMAEVMKDAVAFFNSYGGYILAGVKNSPRTVVGFDGEFDCDELNKRLHAATGRNIECFYGAFEHVSTTGDTYKVGLLYIPQRKDEALPAQFNKDAHLKKSGKKPYSRGDIYLRSADQCIRAESSDHYSFLFTPGRRELAEHKISVSPVLDSNLGARDPGFIQFVGRDSYLSDLWRWFLDRYNPVKLLAGIGGVGKTALAREFAEQVAQAAPFGFQKLVWLSAKRQYFTAISGKYVPASRVDFSTVDELLREIAYELGASEDDLPSDAVREDFMQLAISALSELPALVIVDDLDSLDPDQQQDVFHTLISVFGQTVAGKSAVGSRALLTARLDLGAAPAQVIRVKGLNLDEFSDFVEMTLRMLDLPVVVDRGTKKMERFHRITEGSPTFASSVLRLIVLGESIDHALVKWERADGEDVRRFAFQRELDQLPDSARNVLYALCVLAESTLVELCHVLSRTDQQVRDDFSELRKYHLIAHADSNFPGGTRIAVPGSIRMMKEILRGKVRDSKRIDTECARVRSGSARLGSKIGPQVTRIVALWANSQAEDALELARILHADASGDPDVNCLLGRAYLRIDQPDFKQAELRFRKAQELGCDRPELIPLWVETKANLGDWTGLLEISKFAVRSSPSPEILRFRVSAYEKLADMDRSAGNLHSCAARYKEAGLEIDNTLKQKRLPQAFLELKQARRYCLEAYLNLTDKLAKQADELIDVWLASVLCFNCFVRHSAVLRLGVARLVEWWSAVERREKFHQNTADLMKVQLGKLGDILRVLKNQDNPDEELISQLEEGLNDLGGRLARYQQS